MSLERSPGPWPQHAAMACPARARPRPRDKETFPSSHLRMRCDEPRHVPARRGAGTALKQGGSSCQQTGTVLRRMAEERRASPGLSGAGVEHFGLPVMVLPLCSEVGAPANHQCPHVSPGTAQHAISHLPTTSTFANSVNSNLNAQSNAQSLHRAIQVITSSQSILAHALTVFALVTSKPFHPAILSLH